MRDFIHTIDLKLACLLVAFDIQWRKEEPVTCVVTEKDGKPHEQFTFWFEGNNHDAKPLIEAYYKYKDNNELIMEEGPFRDSFKRVVDALLTREGYMHWMRNKATKQKLLNVNGRVLAIPVGASEKLKENCKRMI